MSSHFCRVGNVKPKLNNPKSLDAIKKQISVSVDVVLNKKPSKGFDVAS